MKKFLTILIIFELLIFLIPKSISADNKTEIIDSQKQNLKISDFINEAQGYTKESMPGIDLNNLLSTAISGNIDNVKLMRLFWSLLRKRGPQFCSNIKQYNCNCCNSQYFKKYK